MSVARNQAKEVFLDVVDLKGDARAHALARACPDDAELRQRVERLLEAHDAAEDLESGGAPEDPSLAQRLAGFGPGDRVGPYRIVEPIGEGGFGSVFLVEQEEPIVRRAALKVIRPGMDSDQLVARFDHERQALARMNHPAIANVLDAGSTDDGRPYFVMEYVSGQPITTFCDEQRLTIDERLRLFTEVCSAVQHAHQKGVIHRDLKPHNVLVGIVDGRPQPKVIDFGIAKAFGGGGVDVTLTAAHQILGTPEFMAPEQASPSSREDVDTRTDVYSLGVLLYHLLTGSSPYDVEDDGIVAWVNAILEDDPVKPSTRVRRRDELARIAGERRLPPAQLPRELSGELDWIVLRAMEKDRAARYPTANALAVEVERYLEDEPVEAGPPSNLYRLKKLVSKHRRMVTVVGVAAVLLLGAAIFSTLAALAALEAQGEAQAALALAERQSYVANVFAAESALQDNEAITAQRYLEAAPAAHRAWEWYYLEARTDQSARVLVTPTGARANSIALSPDGTLLAVPAIDGEHHVFDAASGELLASWHAAEAGLAGFWPTADGTSLMSASYTGQLRRFSWRGELEAQYTQPMERLSMLRTSGDGRAHAASLDGSLYVFDVASTELVAEVEHGFPVALAVPSPDGSRVATCAWDQTFRILDGTSDYRELVTTTACRADTERRESHRFAPAIVSAVAFSPDSRFLLTGARDGLVVLWDATTGERLWEYVDHKNLIREIAWSPDGRRFAAASYDRTATLFDAETRVLIAALVEHDADVRYLSFTPDSSTLVTTSWDKSVRLWNAEDGQPATTLHGHDQLIYRVVFSPQGDSFVTYSEDCTVRTWDLARARREVLNGHENFVLATHQLDDERLFVCEKYDAPRVWDLTRNPPTYRRLDAEGPLEPAYAFHAGSNLLAIGGVGLTLFDGTTLEVVARLPFEGESTRLAFSRDGSRIFAGGRDGSVQALAVTTGERHWVHTELGGKVRGLAQRTDGSLVVVNESGALRILDAGGATLRSFQLAGGLRDLAIAPGEERVATAHSDRSARIVDLGTGEVRHVLSGHGGSVESVCWLPNGTRVVTGSADRTLHLWDPETGEGVASLRGHGATVYALSASADSRRLTSGGGDGSVRLWEAPLP